MKSQKQLEAAAQLPTKQRGCLSQKGLPECLLEVQAGKAKMLLKHELSVNQRESLGQKARPETNVSHTLLGTVRSLFLICNTWWNWFLGW